MTITDCERFRDGVSVTTGGQVAKSGHQLDHRFAANLEIPSDLSQTRVAGELPTYPTAVTNNLLRIT